MKILQVIGSAGGALPNNQIKVAVQNDIPLSKGLGSSAAAVIAGYIHIILSLINCEL